VPRIKKRKSLHDPRVWPTWLLVGSAWLLVRLPLAALIALGGLLGEIFYRLARARRHVTEVNLALCFPELAESERRALARASFGHTAIGALETMLAWLNPHYDAAARTRIYGRESLETARAQGRGVVLVGAHFSSMDIQGPALRALDLDVMYRENKNPVWEWLQLHGRKRFFDGVIERENTREVLRRLKAGRVVWYAADQDYGRKHSVFAPFFGVTAATIDATARLARFNNSPVLLQSNFRDLENRTWSIHFSEVLEGFPSGNAVEDAARINREIERAIRSHPEQYLWMHRRFKTRPPGDPPIY
jgi:KDO2-lipid IV(A) lauroyltransferase